MYRRWSEFQGVPNKFRRDTPHVTISPKGVILLNKIAYGSFGEPAAVHLLYDRSNGTIGLRPCDPALPNAFPVKGKNKECNFLIYGKPFLIHYGVTIDRLVQFNGIETDREGILILDLGSTTLPVRRPMVKK